MFKMKIAIFTQPLGRNYGGIMQAWALQQVLKRQGHEVVTIDRQQDVPSLLYKIARYCYRVFMNALGNRRMAVNLEKCLPYIQKNTLKFISDNISISEKIDSTVQLKSHFDNAEYEAVVVGSDQTWRPKYSPKIENYFLDFLNGKEIRRIAYASSFGVDYWEYTEAQTRLFSFLVKQFDAISVREASGLELCQRCLGVEAQHVLDPTMLLDKEDYTHLIGKERLKNKNQGVFVYFLDKTAEKLLIAKKASEDTCEHIYSAQAKFAVGDNVAANIDDYVMPDPRDWLAGFANAKYVLTDSFHGMVFSIVFNKPFVAIVNPKRGASRFYSLANKLGLESRLVYENSDVDIGAIINKDLNFKNVNASLCELKSNSANFINEALC
jgi:hypothetical protein